jgi:hypothetical protein
MAFAMPLVPLPSGQAERREADPRNPSFVGWTNEH